MGVAKAFQNDSVVSYCALQASGEHQGFSKKVQRRKKVIHRVLERSPGVPQAFRCGSGRGGVEWRFKAFHEVSEEFLGV